MRALAVLVRFSYARLFAFSPGSIELITGRMGFISINNSTPLEEKKGTYER